MLNAPTLRKAMKEIEKSNPSNMTSQLFEQRQPSQWLVMNTIRDLH